MSNEHVHPIFKDILDSFSGDQRRAPVGGCSVGGDRYEGGQFLPEDDFTRSSRVQKSLDDVYGAIRRGRKVIVALFDRDQEAVIERVSESGVLCRYTERFGGERRVWAHPRDIKPLPLVEDSSNG